MVVVAVMGSDWCLRELLSPQYKSKRVTTSDYLIMTSITFRRSKVSGIGHKSGTEKNVGEIISTFYSPCPSKIQRATESHHKF